MQHANPLRDMGRSGKIGSDSGHHGTRRKKGISQGGHGAQQALAEEEVPIGAVIVHGEQVIAAAHNQREQLKDPTAHRIMGSSFPRIDIPADWVEACAFAWLAKRCIDGQPGSLPEVTGARGPRVLGSITPR